MSTGFLHEVRKCLLASCTLRFSAHCALSLKNTIVATRRVFRQDKAFAFLGNENGTRECEDSKSIRTDEYCLVERDKQKEHRALISSVSLPSRVTLLWRGAA